MAIIKSYTDIYQSKKLAEILPLESADMYYFLDPTPAGNIYHLVVQQIDFGVKTREPEYDKGDISCWSLAALLGILPNSKDVSTTLSRGGWNIESVEYVDKWWCEYEDDTHTKDFSVSADNPVDACYELVLKLHELNLL